MLLIIAIIFFIKFFQKLKFGFLALFKIISLKKSDNRDILGLRKIFDYFFYLDLQKKGIPSIGKFHPIRTWNFRIIKTKISM